jgi:Domain of unknown function (DUF4387)/Acyclic terpene utilisation family protein AtuA
MSTRSHFSSVSACYQQTIVNGPNIYAGSAGGDGSSRGVELFIGIIRDIIAQKGYRPMKLLSIDAQIDKDFVRNQHSKGLVRPCGKAVPELQARDIDDASIIVAQMGIEPWLKAMDEHPDFDIIVGGRSYDPSPYAAYCIFKGIASDLAIPYHMGKIMECGALCAVPKSREALAIVRQDSFDIRALDDQSRCTAVSVAAHTLYEKTRPDILTGPGGDLHLENTTYEELPDQKTVRVRGASFVPVKPGEYTVKLEAGRKTGFHSMFIGGFTDAILISQIDDFLARGTAYVKANLSYDFDIDWRIYGKDGTKTYGKFNTPPSWSSVPPEIGICCHVRAGTQDEATNAAHMARIFCAHGPYRNQRATAGNFAMPFAPLDIPLGATSDFCIYHTMIVNDPSEHFPVHMAIIDGEDTAPKTPPEEVAGKKSAGSPTKGLVRSSDNGKSVLSGLREPAPGHIFLADLAEVIRSKNAGPYELTFDVMFPNAQMANKVKETGILTPSTIARLYDMSEDDVIACLWWDPAFAFKATIKRPIVSGGFFERDTYGSTQHMPLMLLEVPVKAGLNGVKI